MTAAAHTLHQHLHIHLVDGPGADIGLMLIVRQNNGCLDVVDIQQLICSLRAHNRGAFYIFRGAYGYGESVIQLRMAHCFCLRFVFRHIAAEHLAHTGHIRAAASQKGRRLKRTHARLAGKVICIDDNSGVQAVCLHGLNFQSFIKVLQNLRHHLAGRGRVGLNVGKNGIVNLLIGLSVMIQYHNRRGP